jgi:transcriptional regulator with XRE-family HTH domain
LTTTYRRERRRLGARLRQLREAAGPSGNTLAGRLGWQQSKVSRIETGKQLPSPEDVRAWAAELQAGPGVVDELLALLDRARAEYATWREHYRAAGGAAAKQVDLLAFESQATRIGRFQVAMIPGLLQTAEYARELLHLPCGPGLWGADEEQLARMVAARMQRQQVLYQPGKRIQVVILEAALRTRVVSPAALAGQLDRLVAVAGLPTLELGVIPIDGQVPVFPLSGFAVYDEDLVVVETITGETQLSEPDEVAQYSVFLQLLMEASARGPAAVEVIQSVLAGLRG